jgi:hypothetical protein
MKRLIAVMNCIKTQKQSRTIHGHFKPFLPGKAHGYCVPGLEKMAVFDFHKQMSGNAFRLRLLVVKYITH